MNRRAFLYMLGGLKCRRIQPSKKVVGGIPIRAKFAEVLRPQIEQAERDWLRRIPPYGFDWPLS